MAGKEIWFGTREYMTWIPAPLANHPTGMIAWREIDTFLNGGAGVRRSQATHKTLDWSWGVQSAESLAPVIAAFQRQGPYFVLEPIAAKTNAVPPYWATPTDGGPPLIPGIVPTLVNTGNNSQGYSKEGLQYVTSSPTNTKLELPVPEGFTLHLGVHGSGSGYWSWVTGTGSAQAISLNSTQRTNMTWTGPGIAQLRSPQGTFTVNGIIAQILPTGELPQSGPFLPGMGNSAMELNGDPSITNYSAVIDHAQIGIAASFVETGAWL